MPFNVTICVSISVVIIIIINTLFIIIVISIIITTSTITATTTATNTTATYTMLDRLLGVYASKISKKNPQYCQTVLYRRNSIIAWWNKHNPCTNSHQDYMNFVAFKVTIQADAASHTNK